MRPLHYACKEGYLSIVEYLIEKGAKIDAFDADNWTPLHYACAKGHLDIIKFIKSNNEILFQRLIQIKTNTQQASCLHLVVQHGNIPSVEYILNEISNEILKILINEQAQPFGTPLHIAGKYNSMKFYWYDFVFFFFFCSEIR
jgi:ankyrin repeat protein